MFVRDEKTQTIIAILYSKRNVLNFRRVNKLPLEYLLDILRNFFLNSLKSIANEKKPS